MQRVLEELKQGFGLKSKHILILEALYEKKLGAEEICKTTNIPQGRIYAYLNELLEMRLINRTPKKPYSYSLENIRDNVTHFLKLRLDDLARKQERIIDIIEEKNPLEEIEIVNNGDEFAFKLMQIIAETSQLKTIVRHGSLPFPLYPEDSISFEKVRKAIIAHRETLAHTTHETTMLIYKSHQDAYHNGKSFFSIMEKKALESNFSIIKKVLGKEFLRQMIRELKNKCRSGQLTVYVVDEYIPMQIFISSRKVFLSIIHLGVTTGVIVRGKRAVSLYNNFFEDMIRRSKPLTQYLAKMEKNI